MRPATILAMNALDASKDEISAPISTSQLFYCSAQIVVSGGATGTLKLQFSNDIINQGPALIAPTNWIDIPNASSTVSTDGVTGIPITNICYAYIQAVWTHNNAHAGTISVNIQVMGN